MRWAIRLAIELYWRLLRIRLQRRCLFRESCSKLVYRVATETGSISAIAALLGRMPRCRPGYVAVADEHGVRFELADGSTLDQSKAAQWLVEFAMATIPPDGNGHR